MQTSGCQPQVAAVWHSDSTSRSNCSAGLFVIPAGCYPREGCRYCIARLRVALHKSTRGWAIRNEPEVDTSHCQLEGAESPACG